MTQRKPERPASKPAAVAAAKGRHISEDDDFGEQTYARALKAVTKAISQVEKKVATPGKPAPRGSKR